LLPALVPLFISEASGAQRYWVGPPNGLWSDPNNWSAAPGGPGGAGVPQPLDAAVAPSGITARFDYVYAQPGIGTQNWRSPVSITQDVPSSVMVAINEMDIPMAQPGGGTGQGSYTHGAGTVMLNMNLRLGHATNESSDIRGYYTLSGNATLNIASALFADNGLYTQTGGLCNINGHAELGNAFGSKPGGIAMSGGTLNVGAGGLGQNVGASTFSGGRTTIEGVLNSWFGRVTVSGGIVSAGSIETNFASRVVQTGGTVVANGPLRITDGGSFTYGGGSLTVGALELSGFSQFIISPGGDKVARTRGMMTTGSLAKVDLSDNAATVDYEPGSSPLSSIRSQVISAYNNGSWTGGGIGSSLADATTRGVGYAEASSLNSIPSIFGAADETTVLIRLTGYGDADLSGTVNLSDFNRLAANFGQGVGAVWSQGDFNYDGRINLNDFNLLASNFGLSATGPTVMPQDWSALASVVPEPVAVGWFGVAASVAFCLRSRRHRALTPPQNPVEKKLPNARESGLTRAADAL